MKSCFLSISSLLYIILYLPLSAAKFIEIKTLSSGKYFIAFHDKFAIYNKDFTPKITFNYQSASIQNTDNIIINKYIFNGNIFIFSLINNYIYVYNDNKEKFFYKNIYYLIDNTYLSYEYYNIIPYNKDGILKLGFISIRKIGMIIIMIIIIFL